MADYMVIVENFCALVFSREATDTLDVIDYFRFPGRFCMSLILSGVVVNGLRLFAAPP